MAKLEKQLTSKEEEIAELQEQVDENQDALAMVEQLTAKNLNLEEARILLFLLRIGSRGSYQARSK